jgi:integrase
MKGNYVMSRRNPANESAKHRYLVYLKHVDGKSDKTRAQHEKAILRFETFTGFSDFRKFDQKQAIGFKENLQASSLTLASIATNINQVKRFLGWLRMETGYKRCIKLSDIEYLNLSEKDRRAAAAPADKAYPSLIQIERVVQAMPTATDIDLRNRALIAFTAITGIRDGAAISLKLKHFDLARMLVLQNPREVSTKASKRIDTFFFPLSNSLEKIVIDWILYLKNQLAFGSHDPLFAKTAVGQDKNHCFAAKGLSKQHWSTASSMRRIFKTAFETIGERSYGPHSFRHMIVSEAYARKLSHAELKAWSQNLGHEGLLVTLNSYGKLSIEEQGRLIRNHQDDDKAEELITRSELEKILRARKS